MALRKSLNENEGPDDRTVDSSEEEEETENNDEEKDTDAESDISLDLISSDDELSSDEELDREPNENTNTDNLVCELTELLNKVRTLVRMVRKSGVLSSHVAKKIKDENINQVNFLLDFHVRWNSTYLMITRLKVLKKIANDLTTHPEAIEGVKPKQIVKLKSLEINNDEWNTIDILIKLLKPFFHATKTMSGQNYSTLSLSFVTRDLLKKFLNSNDANESKKETILKRTLSEALEYHLFTKISKEQNQAQQILHS